MSGDWRNRGAGQPRNVVAPHDAVSYADRPMAIGNFVDRQGQRDGWAVAPGFEAGAVARLEWMRAQMMGSTGEEGDCGCGCAGPGGCGGAAPSASPGRYHTAPSSARRRVTGARSGGVQLVGRYMNADGSVTEVGEVSPHDPAAPRSSGQALSSRRSRFSGQTAGASIPGSDVTTHRPPPGPGGIVFPPYPHRDPSSYDSGDPGLPPVPPTPVPEWQPDGVVFQPPPPPPDDVMGWNPTYPPTPVPPPGSVVADCEIVLPPVIDPEVDPSIPTGPGGVSPAASPAQAAMAPVFGASTGAQAAPYPVPQSLQAPPRPLCPPLYTYDYEWQSCWPDDSPPPGPPPSPYQHACRCPPGESWLVDEWECWTHGDPVYGAVDTIPLPPGLSGGEHECDIGFVWDTAMQRCVFDECPQNWYYDVSLDACVNMVSQCQPPPPIEFVWQHLPTDCVGSGDGWRNEINDAIGWSVTRLFPAWKMLKELDEAPVELAWWKQHMWEQAGDHTPPLSPGSPSMEYWFGEYDDYLLELVTWVVSRALFRVLPGTPHPVQIRCDTLGACCDGDDACANLLATQGGRIKLCEGWHDSDPPDQAIIMLHELNHHVLLGRLYVQDDAADNPPPHDVLAPSICIHDDTDGECYFEDNSIALRQSGATLRCFDQEEGEWRNVRATVLNVDNYVYWLASRFNVFEWCTLPPGAMIP